MRLAPAPSSTHGTWPVSRHPPSPSAVALTSPPVLARPVLPRPGGDRGQDPPGGPAAGQDRDRAEQGGQERRGQQHGAEFLQRDHGLGGARPGPAVLLADDQAGQAQLLGHQLPDRRVVARRVVKQGADRLRGPVRLGERAEFLPERRLRVGAGGACVHVTPVRPGPSRTTYSLSASAARAPGRFLPGPCG
jgi:hypothetical protein